MKPLEEKASCANAAPNERAVELTGHTRPLRTTDWTQVEGGGGRSVEKPPWCSESAEGLWVYGDASCCVGLWLLVTPE